MPDEDAFLAAIAANPADDTPRLVYADWLEDRGDPRAEYLRLEVERHRLKPKDERRTDLTARLEALRPAADSHWLTQIDRAARYSYYWPQAANAHGEVVGSPLSELWAGPFRLPPELGSYIYVVYHREGRLHLLGRMRIDDVVVTTYRPYSEVRTFVSREGTPITLNRAIPEGPLLRTKPATREQERRLTFGPGGRPPTTRNMAGVRRLSPDVATAFDRLLRAG